jgi:hypothetical protein
MAVTPKVISSKPKNIRIDLDVAQRKVKERAAFGASRLNARLGWAVAPQDVL